MLKEKIIEILYWWSMKTFYKKGDKIQKADDIADQILQALIEALPKEKDDPWAYGYNIDMAAGFNEALNQIKNLLK